MSRKLDRLRRLSSRSRRWLAQGLLLLPATALLLRVAGYGRSRAWLGRVFGLCEGPRSADAEELAAALAIAARHLPVRPTCLTRSLALWALLRRQGIESEIRFGAVLEGGRLSAHAWVEHEGRVIGDSAQVAARFPALGPSRQRIRAEAVL